MCFDAAPVPSRAPPIEGLYRQKLFARLQVPFEPLLPKIVGLNLSQVPEAVAAISCRKFEFSAHGYVS